MFVVVLEISASSSRYLLTLAACSSGLWCSVNSHSLALHDFIFTNSVLLYHTFRGKFLGSKGVPMNTCLKYFKSPRGTAKIMWSRCPRCKGYRCAAYTMATLNESICTCRINLSAEELQILRISSTVIMASRTVVLWVVLRNLVCPSCRYVHDWQMLTICICVLYC